MTLLQARDRARKDRRAELYAETRERLRRVLSERIPGQKVMVFGSLTRPGRFHDRSDVDLALFEEPPGISIYSFISELEERMRRRVDVVLLEGARLKDKILREGEEWTV